MATEGFRQVVLLISFVFSIISLSLVATGLPGCKGVSLKFALFLIFVIYAGIFGLILMQFIGLASTL